MKKIIFSLLFIVIAAFGFAQPPGGGQPKGEKVKALYVAFITESLNLTSSEAQAFWPIHAQYDAEIRTVKDEASELDRQQAILNIKRKYQDRFAKVIGNERTNEFFIKDGEFRKRMIDRLRTMRQQGGGGGRGGMRLMPE